MPATDPVNAAELLDQLVRFGAANSNVLPLEVLTDLRNLIVRLQDLGIPLAPLAPVPVAPPQPEVRQNGPTRVQLAVDADEQGNPRIRPKNERAAATAHTLNTILDLMARKPLGSMAEAALEFAAHIEALEQENAALRAELGA